MGDTANAVFVGLSTIDIAYLVDCYPVEDSKTQAVDQFLGAGGPATNAAITFAFLSEKSPTLITLLGQHYLTEIVRTDLATHRVQLMDAAQDASHEPPISSIIVSHQTASRTVVSLDALRIRASPDKSLASSLDSTAVVLLDGHYPELARALAREAKLRGIPILLDAGRWKPVHADLLGLADIAICSAAFSPVGMEKSDDATLLSYMHDLGVLHAAITHGPQPIVYSTAGERPGIISIKPTAAIDTLGAGDILHGAFCYYFTQGEPFARALSSAAEIASLSTQHFGTRRWMKTLAT